ncbi:efflux RND transporter permease subunit [Oceanicaulis sp. MMSF_3324]|uniref:efflux RND transporter permease subunit n=1 Tax=Oceanicaulis sp. MMSF_3324 TaxID=3046702 RepID=UPI0027402EDF|nr:CusA/CzcA family heavy metal efflux RND transporter [Oceanicaulis sp. MMSF_3324]
MAITTKASNPERLGWAHKIVSAKGLALFAFLAVLVAGVWSWRTLPVDAFPDITPPLVQVFTVTDGLSPQEVERYVTFPVETAMSGLPGLDQVRSNSTFGLSVVTVYFEDGTDIYLARQLVSERLDAARADMPPGFGEPELGPITTGLGQVLFYYLESANADLIGLRTVQDWLVKLDLQTVPGVTEVLSLGGYERQYQVNVRPQALVQYDLVMGDVITALERANLNAGAQYIVENNEQYTVRAEGLLHGEADLRQVVVKAVDGVPVVMGEIADIAVGGAPRQGLATMNGEGEVVAGLVLKLTGANTNAVIAAVTDRLSAVNDALPDGVVARPYYDQSELVGQAVSTMTTALWQGALLVGVLLMVFMGGWRPGLIVAASIPFSVAFALIAMRVLDVSANLMSLGGIAIAIGMMVDGAVVIVENARRRLSGEAGQDETALLAASLMEVIKPLGFSIAIVMLVFLPIVTLQGVEGKTFRPLAFAVILAMAGSLVFALFVAPAASRLLKAPARPAGTEPTGRLEARLGAAIGFFVARRALAAGLAMAMLATGALAFTRLGSEFSPRLNEGDILVRMTMAPSISLDAAKETVTRFERDVLERFPQVERVVTRVGRGEVGAHADPVNNAESFLALKPRAEWGAVRNQEALLAQMSAAFEDFPGAQFNFTQPIAAATDELLTGSRAEIAIKLFGPDTDVLAQEADEVAAVVSTVRGAADVQVEQVGGAPQISIEVDRAAMARYGLQVADVLETVQDAIGGARAGQVFDGVRRFDIIARYAEADRDTPERIARTLIEGPNGERLPLGALARVERIEGPRQVTRENGRRFITIQTNVRERDIGSFVQDAQAAVADQLELPPGYLLEWGGQFELQQQANARFAVIVPVTLGLVFLLLLAAFGRLKSAALIVLNIPLALVGGLVALWLSGLNLSVPASVGFIALFGIALGNAMVLVSFLDRLARQGGDRDSLSVQGALLRVRPVLMTAATTMLGLAPLLFASGVGSEVQRPLATVVIGGLVSSTLVTVFIVPAVYAWFAPRPEQVAD